MHHALSFMEPNIIWSVVNGAKINVFRDRWVPSINDRIPIPDEWDTSFSHVRDLIDLSTHHWNVSLINNVFYPSTATTILKTPINIFDADREDRTLWLPSKDGHFTSKSCYRTLRSDISNNSLTDAVKAFMHKVWTKLSLQLRVKHFAWRCAFDSLLTNARRASFISTVNPCCHLCLDSPETVKLILFSCLLAAEVWELAGKAPQTLMADTFRGLLNTWLNDDSGDYSDCTHSLCIAWVLWKVCYEAILQGRCTSAPLVLHHALSLHNAALPPSATPINTWSTIYWNSSLSPPKCLQCNDAATVMINVDGGTRESYSCSVLIDVILIVLFL